jgi:hypothetical protein
MLEPLMLHCTMGTHRDYISWSVDQRKAVADDPEAAARLQFLVWRAVPDAGGAEQGRGGATLDWGQRCRQSCQQDEGVFHDMTGRQMALDDTRWH